MSSRASALCQDVYPVNAYDLELLPFEPFFLDVGDRGKFVLKLQEPRPLVNYALENYASRSSL